MPDSFTFTKLADAFAGFEGRSEDSKSKLHRQFRYLLTLGFIEKSVEQDARGTAEFDLYNAFKARVGVALLDLGLDVKGLRDADMALKKPYFGPSPAAGARPHGHLGAALQGIVAGQAWSFYVSMLHSPTTGESRLIGHCRPDADPDDPEVKRILSDYRRLVRGEVEQATVSIPLNPLLKPLLG